MAVQAAGAGSDDQPGVRFRHVGGITAGMDVAWTFASVAGAGTRVRIVHVWDGPHWPLVGGFAATGVIGPVFVHGIASRTLAGLAAPRSWIRGARRARSSAARNVTGDPCPTGGAWW